MPLHGLCSDMVAHMKHMKQVGGIGCIGLGSDFDGIDDRNRYEGLLWYAASGRCDEPGRLYYWRD